MPEGDAPARGRRVVVMGADAAAVGRAVRRRRQEGDRVAGYVGADEPTARAMAEEMLGGVDEVVAVGEAAARGEATARWRPG